MKYQVVQWFLEASDQQITEVIAEIVQEISGNEADYQSFVETIHEGLDQI